MNNIADGQIFLHVLRSLNLAKKFINFVIVLTVHPRDGQLMDKYQNTSDQLHMGSYAAFQKREQTNTS
jgi:hypothetical protein